MTSRYFDKAGWPLSLSEWACLVIDADYRVLAFDASLRYRVSTIWTGYEHGRYEATVFIGSSDEVAATTSTDSLEAVLEEHHRFVISYVPIIDSMAALLAITDEIDAVAMTPPERSQLFTKKRSLCAKLRKLLPA